MSFHGYCRQACDPGTLKNLYCPKQQIVKQVWDFSISSILLRRLVLNLWVFFRCFGCFHLRVPFHILTHVSLASTNCRCTEWQAVS